MTTSTLIFLSAAGCGLLFAACAVWAQMHSDVAVKQAAGAAPRRRVRWTQPVLILAACCALGGMAYLIDSDVAGTTLYEVEAAGSGPVVPEAVRFDIPVEHPGVEHDLLVAPNSDAAVTTPAELQVQVTDPTGRVLLDRSAAVEPRDCDPLCEWGSFTETFTPAVPGTHTLVVTVSTPDVPVLHVRVGDPDKTDGRRAPGY